jgi:hypothetical protein
MVYFSGWRGFYTSDSLALSVAGKTIYGSE